MSAVAKRYYERGIKALSRGDLQEATETLASAIEVYPAFVSARLAYGAALCRSGNAQRAAEVLRAGLAKKNTGVSEAALWAGLGDALSSIGQLKEAVDSFKQAARYPGFERRAQSGIARAHGKAGKYADAFAALAVAATDV